MHMHVRCHHDYSLFMSKISIIIPIYNVEAYLPRCVHAARSQTLADIEIILVDDGSPDNCPALCDSYALEDKRIKVIHKNNEGLGLARNTGIDAASSDYVMFVDSDDYLERDACERLYSHADSCNGEADMIMGGYNIYRNEKFDRVSRDTDATVVLNDAECKEAMLFMLGSNPEVKFPVRKINGAAWHSLYKLSTLRDNDLYFFSERQYISEDIHFHMRLMPQCHKIIIVPDIVYNYCMRFSNTLTTKVRKDKWQKEIDLIDAATQYVKAHYSQDCSVWLASFVIGRYIDALGYMMHYDPDMNAGKLQEMSNYMQVQHSLAYRKRTGLSKAKELFLDLVNTRHYKLAYCVYRQYTRLKSIVNK